MKNRPVKVFYTKNEYYYIHAQVYFLLKTLLLLLLSSNAFTRPVSKTE